MAPTLCELQRIPTSGARAVEAFRIGGRDLLAIPQLALDIPGTPAGMNGGDSNTELLILERRDGAYAPYATVPAPGGEDAEFFTIGDRTFLAAACIRTGSGPYEYDTESFVYEWTGERFELFQSFSTFAAKQWKHWTIGDRHFLGLAQGLALPHVRGPQPQLRDLSSGTASSSSSSRSSRRSGPTTGTRSRSTTASSWPTPTTSDRQHAVPLERRTLRRPPGASCPAPAGPSPHFDRR